MFKQWFANLRNPSSALASDDKALETARKYATFPSDELFRMTSDLSMANMRIKFLRRALGKIAAEKKQVSRFEFEEQLKQLLKAQEAMAHQNMVASKNQNITDILYNALREEYARTMFLVFEDLDTTPEEAEEKYAAYLSDAMRDEDAK